MEIAVGMAQGHTAGQGREDTGGRETSSQKEDGLTDPGSHSQG